MTGAQALAAAVGTLRAAGVADPARDARRLLAFALGVAPGRLTLVLQDSLEPAVTQAYEALIARRARREPVSHLIGRRDFYGRSFVVTRDVLDPRPDTETLIDQALKHRFDSVLDLGTGSGCILVTLLADRQSARGVGTDISAKALDIAKRNAHMLDVAERATFATGSWFDALPDHARFDLIISNPPYIAIDEMRDLAAELAFEPRNALTDEGDGLAAYRAITERAGKYLTPEGRLMVEIGPSQAKDVCDLFEQNGFVQIAVTQDLDGRDRVVSGVFPPQIVAEEGLFTGF